MERSFLASNESKYRKGFYKYVEMVTQQGNFISTFFKEKGIKANEYKVCGNGSCNLPFEENEKSEIRLGIIPTDEDLNTYGNNLTKPNEYDLCYFKKSSKIAKEFAQRCVDEKVIINIYKPRVSDYFKSIRGCNKQQFEYNGDLYIKIESEWLEEDDIPVGFKEIKLSEYHIASEEYESSKGEDK